MNFSKRSLKRVKERVIDLLVITIDNSYFEDDSLWLKCPYIDWWKLQKIKYLKLKILWNIWPLYIWFFVLHESWECSYNFQRIDKNFNPIFLQYKNPYLSFSFRATNTSEGVTSLRPPRFLSDDGVIRPYRLRDGAGSQMLQVTKVNRSFVF